MDYDYGVLNQRSQDIFAGNVEAGWWTNIATGESIVATRNRPEIMMLVVTELSEANDGLLRDKMDDKLPHRDMVEVEVADAAIRLHDLAGAEGIAVSDDDWDQVNVYMTEYDRAHNSTTGIETSLTGFLMAVTDLVSTAMEGYRKSKTDKFHSFIRQALIACYYVADEYNMDLEGAIKEKLAFNKVREDHKIDNRLKHDGKKC